jgi:hypothetical protein
MVDIVSICPHIPSLDVQVTCDFFMDLLDFQIQYQNHRMEFLYYG